MRAADPGVAGAVRGCDVQVRGRSVGRMRGYRVAFLPLAITFGALTVLLLASGQQTWVAFLPLTITFAILSASGRDDDEGKTDDAATTIER